MITPKTEPTSIPPSTQAPPPTTIPPQPEHSSLYIPGLSVEDVIQFFNEVCLDAEIINSGNPSLLQKWAEPIRFMVYGDPTRQDLAVLNGFVEWVNTVEGFPGMFPAANEDETNLRIHFCTHSELIQIMGDVHQDSDGAVTFWYTDNRIHDATICIRTDLEQDVRCSVILEELYNGLGPVQDTQLRQDSIIYEHASDAQTLTETDKLILKLLYHPSLLYGMDAAQCAEQIRILYY